MEIIETAVYKTTVHTIEDGDDLYYVRIVEDENYDTIEILDINENEEIDTNSEIGKRLIHFVNDR